MTREYPDWFIAKIKSVKAKRAKTVIDHILKHKHITTEELKALYGYDHPPRAARDVREQGIPLETFRITGTQGKSIAAYRFADPNKIRSGTLSGRKVFSKQFKESLAHHSGSKCSICMTEYEIRYLQVDHRIPYEVGGDSDGENLPEDFQLICGSCNRAKSWSCEHCSNWSESKDTDICRDCYWANSETYTHIASLPIRRVDVTWSGNETNDYDQLVKIAKKSGEPFPDFVKAALRKMKK